MAGAAVRLPLGAGGPGPHQGPDAGRRAVPGLADLHVHRRAAATSARSTSSSRRPAACSSSRSRATPARRPTTARPGCSATATRLRTIENPLHFTDTKAKELKSQLERAARKLNVREPHPAHRAGRLPVGGEPQSAGSTSSSASASTAATTRQPDRPATASGPASSTSRRRARGTASRPPSPSSSRSSCRRSASPALHRIGRVGPYELASQVLRRRPDLGGLPRRPTRRCRTTSRAASASTSPSGPRPTRSGSRSSAPPTASTWRCRASRTTASSGPSSTATSSWPGPAVVFRHGEGLAAPRPLHGRDHHATCPATPGWR